MKTPGAGRALRPRFVTGRPAKHPQRGLYQALLAGARAACFTWLSSCAASPSRRWMPRVGRILSVGTDSHRRLQRALGRACLGQEVFFEVPEYRIHGFCDGILYARPDQVRTIRDGRLLGPGVQDDRLERVRSNPLRRRAQRRTHPPGADLPVGPGASISGARSRSRAPSSITRTAIPWITWLSKWLRPGGHGAAAGAGESHAGRPGGRPAPPGRHDSPRPLVAPLLSFPARSASRVSGPWSGRRSSPKAYPTKCWPTSSPSASWPKRERRR